MAERLSGYYRLVPDQCHFILQHLLSKVSAEYCSAEIQIALEMLVKSPSVTWSELL